MTSAQARRMMRLPRRWDGGSPAGPRFQRRSRGLQSDTSPGMAARPSRAPVPRTSDPGLGGKGAGDSLDARSRTRGCGLRRSLSPIPRTAWWRGQPSVERPSEAAGQGVLCAPPVLVMAAGREPGRPAPPSIPSGGRAAARLVPLDGRANGKIHIKNQQLGVDEFSLATDPNWCITRACCRAAPEACAAPF
jgi:hypothetical protein